MTFQSNLGTWLFPGSCQGKTSNTLLATVHRRRWPFYFPRAALQLVLVVLERDGSEPPIRRCLSAGVVDACCCFSLSTAGRTIFCPGCRGHHCGHMYTHTEVHSLY